MHVMCTEPFSCMKLVDWERKKTIKNLCRSLRTFIGLFSSLQQSQEGLCMLWSQCHSRPPGGETCTRGVPQCFREGVGGLCHCEEALNGNSWHQRRQLTTRTITYWTKKPMEKQHRIYVVGF